MVPMVFAKAGFRATGKFKPTTAPDSMSSSNDRRTMPFGSEAQDLPSYSSFGGQKTRRTSGSVSKSERKTTMPWMMEVLTSERKNFQCSQYQYWMLSKRSRWSGRYDRK